VEGGHIKFIGNVNFVDCWELVINLFSGSFKGCFGGGDNDFVW